MEFTTKSIGNPFRGIAKRLLVDDSITEMKDNLEKLMKEDSIDVCKILHNTGVIGEEYLVTDSVYRHNEEVYEDVEFFKNINKKTTTVFEAVHNCSTNGGKDFSRSVYSKAISDLDLLNNRQKCLRRIEKTYLDNKEKVDTLLQTLANNEKNVAWLLEEKEENVKDLYSMVFFRLKGLLPLNNIGSALTTYNLYRVIISPLFGIVAPIFYFLIPYLIVLYKFKVYIPFTSYIKTMFFALFHSSDTLFGNNKLFKYLRIVSYMFSAAFYFQGIFTSVDIAKTVHKMSKLIVTSFNSVIDYVQAANELQNLFWPNDDQLSSYVNMNKACPHSIDAQEKYLATISKCKRKYTLFGNFGEQLKIYKHNNVSVMKQMVRKACIIDALLGAVKLKIDRTYTFTEFVNVSEKPKIHMIGMVHPCIALESTVTNDLQLGGEHAQNAIITSPNSSGKSILIKSIIINVLMSQSMGISCCHNAMMTPFQFINTQINVPDATGLESLFEAEMHRCKYTLDKLKELQEDGGFTLTIMDEIFNSTNPVEAVAGAYAVCKKLTSFKTNMLMFTTHFSYLTKLAKEPECHFANYKMETIVNDVTNDITFTYKLQKGVNKHMLALELLKKSGFGDDILDDAIAVKKMLLHKKDTKKN